jgi:hypothetical protein
MMEFKEEHVRSRREQRQGGSDLRLPFTGIRATESSNMKQCLSIERSSRSPTRYMRLNGETGALLPFLTIEVKINNKISSPIPIETKCQDPHAFIRVKVVLFLDNPSPPPIPLLAVSNNTAAQPLACISFCSSPNVSTFSIGATHRSLETMAARHAHPPLRHRLFNPVDALIAKYIIVAFSC